MAFWKDTYEKVGGGQADYTTYDPGSFMAMLQKFMGGFLTPEGTYGGSYTPQTSGFDPQAWMSDFTSNWGGIKGLVDTETDKLRNDLLTGATRESQLAGQAMADQFAGLGQGGAQLAAISGAMADPFAKVADTVAQSRLGLLGALGGQAMGLGADAQKYADQSALGWGGLNLQGAGLDQSMMQMLMSGMLGGGGTWSTMVAPTYAPQQAGWKDLLGAGMGVAGAVSDFLPQNWLAELLKGFQPKQATP